MPVWRIDPVEQRPQVTLRSWAVYEVPLDGQNKPWTRHLAGYTLEEQPGQVSSPVLTFDPAAGRCVTRSGRIYQLHGRPGLSSDALYVWSRWKDLAGIAVERDVTDETCEVLERVQAATRLG